MRVWAGRITVSDELSPDLWNKIGEDFVDRLARDMAPGERIQRIEVDEQQDLKHMTTIRARVTLSNPYGSVWLAPSHTR